MEKNSHRKPSIQVLRNPGNYDTSNPKAWIHQEIIAASAVVAIVKNGKAEQHAGDIFVLTINQDDLNGFPSNDVTFENIQSAIGKLHRIIRDEDVNVMQKTFDRSQCNQELCFAISRRQLQRLEQVTKAAMQALSQNLSRFPVGEEGEARREKFPKMLKYADQEVCNNSYKVLDNICAFIPEINLYKRSTQNQSKLGWQCWQTSKPGTIAATLALKLTNIISAVGLGEMICNFFKESGIKAKISFDSKSQCQTLCIAYNMDNLNRIDQTKFREQLGHQVMDVAKEYIAHYFPGQFGHEPPSV